MTFNQTLAVLCLTVLTPICLAALVAGEASDLPQAIALVLVGPVMGGAYLLADHTETNQ